MSLLPPPPVPEELQRVFMSDLKNLIDPEDPVQAPSDPAKYQGLPVFSVTLEDVLSPEASTPQFIRDRAKPIGWAFLASAEGNSAQGVGVGCLMLDGKWSVAKMTRGPGIDNALALRSRLSEIPEIQGPTPYSVSILQVHGLHTEGFWFQSADLAKQSDYIILYYSMLQAEHSLKLNWIYGVAEGIRLMMPTAQNRVNYKPPENLGR